MIRILIPLVYFIAGATSLASVAATFFYKETLGLTLEQVQFIGSAQLIPWSIKPIYGFISDRRPIFKLRRKPYLFIAGLLASAGYLSMGTWVSNFTGTFIAVVVSGFGFALADVIVDGIVAEQSRSQKVAGKLQSICRAAIMAGALVVAYLSGILVEMIGARNVFLITGALPLATAVFAFLIPEIPQEVKNTLSIKKIWSAIRSTLTPTILLTAFFLFLWRATPNSGGSLSYYMIDELQFDPEFFGRLSAISYAMGIVGVLIFRKFLISIRLRKLLFWIIIASVIFSLPSIGLVYGWYEYLGMSPRMFAMADTFISGPLTEIAFLPMLVLLARVCPKGVEATMFALIASCMNFGLAVSDLGGAWLVHIFDVRQATDTLAANYTHIDKVLWIAILSSLLPMPLLRYLPDIRAAEERTGEPSPSKQSPIDDYLGSEKKNIT